MHLIRFTIRISQVSQIHEYRLNEFAQLQHEFYSVTVKDTRHCDLKYFTNIIRSTMKKIYNSRYKEAV